MNLKRIHYLNLFFVKDQSVIKTFEVYIDY